MVESKMAPLELLHVFFGLLCLLVTKVSADAQYHAPVACQQLKAALGNITFLPSQNTYPSLSTENWYVFSRDALLKSATKPFRSETAWAKPTCILQPIDTPELQQVVRILTIQNVHFAIRSGGHSPSPLAANINDGVLIDMSMFNRVNYDAAHSIATVGSGMTWGDIYNQLDPHNITVVGGRVLDVGVGGLILGSESTSYHPHR